MPSPSDVQKLVPAEEVRQVPPTAKQPVLMLMPLPNVEVPVPETFKTPAMVVEPVLETVKRFTLLKAPTEVDDAITKRF